MGHTTTTTTVSLPLLVSYVCSKCGSKNTQISMVSEQGRSTRQGAVIRQSTYDDMAEEAREKASSMLDERITLIIEDAKSNKYRHAELKCKCQHCRHVEPWSKMRFRRLESFLGWLMAMTIFFSLACFVVKDIKWGVRLLIGLAVILVVWELFKKIWYGRLEKQIARLPIKSLPTISIVTDGSDVVLTPEIETAEPESQMAIIDALPVSDNNVTIDNISTVLYCPKCGNEILSDGMFCHKCGKKIKHI